MNYHEPRGNFFGKFVIFVVFPLALIGVGLYLWKSLIEERFSGEDPVVYDALITSAANSYGIDPLLVKAVIRTESKFNCLALGQTNDYGLMQIVPTASVRDWATEFRTVEPSPVALLSPQLNVEIGTWYLSRQIYQLGAKGYPLPVALSAYNAGQKTALEWFVKDKGYTADKNPLEFIRFSSTRAYVKSILEKYKDYQEKAKRTTVISFNLGDDS